MFNVYDDILALVCRQYCDNYETENNEVHLMK